MNTMTLDIGGTAIKSGIFKKGILSDVTETPTEADRGGAHVVERAVEIIKDYRTRHDFGQIGISTAGQVNPATGSIIYANSNIPGYTGTRLKDTMEKTFGLKTFVENDVNAAAIGESAFGAGREMDDFVCLTYGTGIGGAIFTKGRIYSGSSYSAGEFGAIVTHPNDRNPEEDMFSGCYERYASAAALVRNAMLINPSLSNGRLIFEHLEDEAVRRLIDDWIMEIIYGLTSVIHILNPSCVILGGGIMQQPYIFERLLEKLNKNIMPSFCHVKIKRAELGNHAGMLGAAILDRIL